MQEGKLAAKHTVLATRLHTDASSSMEWSGAQRAVLDELEQGAALLSLMHVHVQNLNVAEGRQGLEPLRSARAFAQAVGSSRRGFAASAPTPATSDDNSTWSELPAQAVGATEETFPVDGPTPPAAAAAEAAPAADVAAAGVEAETAELDSTWSELPAQAVGATEETFPVDGPTPPAAAAAEAAPAADVAAAGVEAETAELDSTWSELPAQAVGATEETVPVDGPTFPAAAAAEAAPAADVAAAGVEAEATELEAAVAAELKAEELEAAEYAAFEERERAQEKKNVASRKTRLRKQEEAEKKAAMAVAAEAGGYAETLKASTATLDSSAFLHALEDSERPNGSSQRFVRPKPPIYI